MGGSKFVSAPSNTGSGATVGLAAAPISEETTAAPQLKGEPRRPKDSNQVAATMSASIDAEPVAPTSASNEVRAMLPAASARSTLEKLAEYFVSPIKHGALDPLSGPRVAGGGRERSRA